MSEQRQNVGPYLMPVSAEATAYLYVPANISAREWMFMDKYIQIMKASTLGKDWAMQIATAEEEEYADKPSPNAAINALPDGDSRAEVEG